MQAVWVFFWVFRFKNNLTMDLITRQTNRIKGNKGKQSKCEHIEKYVGVVTRTLRSGTQLIIFGGKRDERAKRKILFYSSEVNSVDEIGNCHLEGRAQISL